MHPSENEQIILNPPFYKLRQPDGYIYSIVDQSDGEITLFSCNTNLKDEGIVRTVRSRDFPMEFVPILAM